MAPKDDEQKKPDDAADGSGPMLDMSQAAVKKMIATAKARGYITYDELNEVLPPDQVTSEQIEDVMSMLSEMGINVIDAEEADDDEDDDQGNLSLAAMEAALKPQVLETLDLIAEHYV
ncbi:MAG TPA: RNA polymerase sigma factor region1.1 domain-containing protein, partial [Amaricoccus sp.]|nr:RNA polymerase sigma factor region1.1 domain-containing protein [Amaricoccus sp.]